MPTPITASMLYDLVTCPHRVSMDLFADIRQRDEVNPFVQLLWEKGNLHERETIQTLEIPFVDLSPYADAEKQRLTQEAMQRKESLIYGGRIRADDLLGDPDLLRLEGKEYIPGDIKSGAGEEGPEDLKQPKKHYAVQLALYVDILERMKLSSGRRGFVWDIRGEEVVYDLITPQGTKKPRTLWEDYQECLAQVRSIVSRAAETQPAYGSVCKLCHWYSACLSRLQSENDLTLIPELGRSRRESLCGTFSAVRDLAASDIRKFISGKKTPFPGIGPPTLEKFHRRALLICDPSAKPYLMEPLSLPSSNHEIYFDIEYDPMRDICYLHGFVERKNGDNGSERFISFFADEPTQDAEERAFLEAWNFLKANPSAVVYYYSKYERTILRKLREKYHHVCTEAELEALFGQGRAVDLYYDVVLPKSVWPTRDFSIKTLASYLGFSWRDPNPSGAASIEWFHRWVQSQDPSIRQRILDYNEDDCRATRVLLDGIRKMSLGPK